MEGKLDEKGLAFLSKFIVIGGFSRWKTKEKSSSDAIVEKRTEKAHGGGMSGEHLYFKNFM